MKKHFHEIFSQIKNIRSSGSFAQNVSIVFTGNVFNFGLQLVFTPWISRIFGPEAYGEYAVINLIVSNIAFLSAMSLPSVYILPKQNETFLALGKIVFISNLIAILISITLYYFFGAKLVSIELTWFVVVGIAFMILLNTLNAILSSLNQREKKFKKIASINVMANSIAKPSTLAIGTYFIPTGFGLLLGDYIRTLVIFTSQTSIKSKLILIRFLFSNNWNILNRSWNSHINVVKFNFPSQLLSKWTSDLPILFFGLHFSFEELGAYTFASSILYIPHRLFENSVGPVMLQKAAETYNNSPSELKNLFLKSIKTLPIPSGIFITIIAAIGPIIFILFFGDKWQNSGTISGLLWIQVVSNILIAPYKSFWRILKREKRLLFLNTLSSIIRFTPLMLPFTFADLDFNTLIILFSIANAIGTLIILFDLFFHFFAPQRAIKMIAILVILLSLFYFTVNYINNYTCLNFSSKNLEVFTF